MADHDRLWEAIDNLVSNAIKYTPRGGKIELTVECEGRAGEGHGARHRPGSVAGGCGARYSAASSACRPSRPAAKARPGLVLSIVKRIVDLHGGQVAAESAGPDKGSTFSLSLPLERSTCVMNQAMPHIMVVDDEASTRDMVGDYLRMHGFRATLCDGGASLRAGLDKEQPDLIVLDLNMPEEDGLSIIRDLKQKSSVPVIMLTATASAIDRVVGLELGADDYIAKPCELRELVARIRSVLRRVQGAAQAAEEPQAKNKVVRFGTKWLDVDARVLRDDDGVEHPLTASEFNLLKAFADNPKRVLTRERLLDLANARDPDAFDRAIDIRITRIRRKIEADPGASDRDPHGARRRLRVLARRQGAGVTLLSDILTCLSFPRRRGPVSTSHSVNANSGYRMPAFAGMTRSIASR